MIERATRDHAMQLDVERLKLVSGRMQEILRRISEVEDVDSLRGLEGKAADYYFSVFGELIIQQKSDFAFRGRNRRPPLDNVNAMLSFAYSLLEGMCFSALEVVGLDPYVGFMHTLRPGRRSLALDLMEELRSVYADRFVLNLINNRIVDENDFIIQESGGISLTEKARKEFLSRWQARKREEIIHPYLKEKIPWGMVTYSQALLLARCIRGDLDQYPPFFWR